MSIFTPLRRGPVAAALFALLLTGCRADVTFRLDVHANGTALATARAVMDDELYRIVQSQDTTGDALGLVRLEREGWTVSRAYDANADHVVTLSKWLSRNDLSLRKAGPAAAGAALPLSSIRLSRTGGFFTEQDSLAAAIPPLLPWAQIVLKRPYASVAWALVASAVALHLELRTPGRLLRTNGEITPDGYARWDLSFRAPTTILYDVRVVRYDRVALLILIVSCFIFIAVWLAGRRRSTRTGFRRTVT